MHKGLTVYCTEKEILYFIATLARCFPKLSTDIQLSYLGKAGLILTLQLFCNNHTHFQFVTNHTMVVGHLTKKNGVLA